MLYYLNCILFLFLIIVFLPCVRFILGTVSCFSGQEFVLCTILSEVNIKGLTCKRISDEYKKNYLIILLFLKVPLTFE